MILLTTIVLNVYSDSEMSQYQVGKITPNFTLDFMYNIYRNLPFFVRKIFV